MPAKPKAASKVKSKGRGRPTAKATVETKLHKLSQDISKQQEGLVKTCANELKTLQKQLSQIQTKVKKAQAKKKAAKDKRVAAANAAKGAKATAAAKNRLDKAITAYEDAVEALNLLQAAANELKNEFKLANNLAKKYQAQQKLLAKFERDWDKKQSQSSTKATKKRRGTKKATQAKKTLKATKTSAIKAEQISSKTEQQPESHPSNPHIIRKNEFESAVSREEWPGSSFSFDKAE